MFNKYFFLVFFACSSATMIASDSSDDTYSQVSTETPDKYKKISGKKRKGHEDLQPYRLDHDTEPEPLLDLTQQDIEAIRYDFMTQNADVIGAFVATMKDKIYRMYRIVEPHDATNAIIRCHIFHSRNHQLTLSKKYSIHEIQSLHQTQATQIVQSVIDALKLSESEPEAESNS